MPGDYTVTAVTAKTTRRQPKLSLTEALALAEQTWRKRTARGRAQVLVQVWYNRTGKLVQTFEGSVPAGSEERSNQHDRA